MIADPNNFGRHSGRREPGIENIFEVLNSGNSGGGNVEPDFKGFSAGMAGPECPIPAEILDGIIDQVLGDQGTPPVWVEAHRSGVSRIVIPLPHYKEVSELLFVRQSISRLNEDLADKPHWELFFNGEIDAFHNFSGFAKKAFRKFRNLMISALPKLIAEKGEGSGYDEELSQLTELNALLEGVSRDSDPCDEILLYIAGIKTFNSPYLADVVEKMRRLLQSFTSEDLSAKLEEFQGRELKLLAQIPAEFHDAKEPPVIYLSPENLLIAAQDFADSGKGVKCSECRILGDSDPCSVCKNKDDQPLDPF